MSLPCNIQRDPNIKPTEISDALAGHGSSFPAGAKDGMLFARTDLEGSPIFMRDGINAVWQQVGGAKQVTTIPYSGTVE